MSNQFSEKQKKLLILLKQQLVDLVKMEQLLVWSQQRCLGISLKKSELISPEHLEKFESLTARFSRLVDVLLQKSFRLIDTIDLEDSGTIRDRINRAEKKALIASAVKMIEIRELRNNVAHEYQTDSLQSIFPKILEAVPFLLDCVSRVRNYCRRYNI